MIKRLATVFATSLVFALLGPTDSNAQATGASGTTCSQSGQQVTCTTTTVFNMPTGVTLQSGSGFNSFSFNGGSSNAPVCTGLTANPATVTANTQTTVNLSVSGCPTGVSYAWAAPANQVNSSASSHSLTLASGSQAYSVVVCYVATPTACNTYQISVSVIGATPSLSGCSIASSGTTITQGATGTLTASCSTGTGQAGYNVQYQWTKNGSNIAGATGPTYSITSTDTAVTGTVNFGVTITNNAPSTSTPTSVAISVVPSGSGLNLCPSGVSYQTSFNASEIYRKIYSTNLIGTTTHWVVRITVNPGDTTLNRWIAQLNFGEAPSNQRAFRKVSLSKNQCDYTSTPGTTYVITTGTNSGSQEFRINESSRAASFPIELTSGTWYFNVQNTSCPAGQHCDALLEWLN